MEAGVWERCRSIVADGNATPPRQFDWPSHWPHLWPGQSATLILMSRRIHNNQPRIVLKAVKESINDVWTAADAVRTAQLSESVKLGPGLSNHGQSSYSEEESKQINTTIKY